MIPLCFLKKMDTYEVDIQGVKIKVSVIDSRCILDDKLSKLESLVKIRVVGFDLKVESYPNLLVLCVGHCCLIIHRVTQDLISHNNLVRFLTDETICFVGVGMSDKVSELQSSSSYTYYKSDVPRIECKSGVEVGYLAARVLKRPQLSTIGFAKLANEVGIDIKVVEEDGSGTSSDNFWTETLYTERQIKDTIHDAY